MHTSSKRAIDPVSKLSEIISAFLLFKEYYVYFFSDNTSSWKTLLFMNTPLHTPVCVVQQEVWFKKKASILKDK